MGWMVTGRVQSSHWRGLPLPTLPLHYFQASPVSSPSDLKCLCNMNMNKMLLFVSEALKISLKYA